MICWEVAHSIFRPSARACAQKRTGVGAVKYCGRGEGDGLRCFTTNDAIDDITGWCVDDHCAKTSQGDFGFMHRAEDKPVDDAVAPLMHALKRKAKSKRSANLK